MSTITERKKSVDRVIDGPYPEFAQEVRRLLGWEDNSTREYFSTRQASSITGVNYSTVSMMARGFRSSLNNIKQFANALGGDANLLSRLSGHLLPISTVRTKSADELEVVKAFSSPWIATSDRLPEPNEVVLVREVWGGVPRFFTAYRDLNGFWESVGDFTFDGAAITHWMPIPAVDEALTKRAAERQGAIK